MNARRTITPNPKFAAKVRAVLDAHRRTGMNLIVQDDDGRIVKIAPDGTETDVTAELDRRVSEAIGGKPSPAPCPTALE